MEWLIVIIPFSLFGAYLLFLFFANRANDRAAKEREAKAPTFEGEILFRETLMDEYRKITTIRVLFEDGTKKSYCFSSVGLPDLQTVAVGEKVRMKLDPETVQLYEFTVLTEALR